jgi:hypothetical protein
LLSVLPKLPSLIALVLAGNGILGEGLALLANYIATNRQLKSLDISRNKLAKESKYLDTKDLDGISFVAGSTVKHNGHTCIVNQAEDSDEQVKVLYVHGLQALCNAFSTSALETLVFHGFGVAAGKVATLSDSTTEVNFTRKKMGVCGALLVHGFLPKCTDLQKLRLPCTTPTAQKTPIANFCKRRGISLLWEATGEV